MAIVEEISGNLIAALIYDGLKNGGKFFLGPHFKTFQRAQKNALEKLKEEFTEDELLSVFTTFYNMKWKLNFGKEAREEIQRNLKKGVEAINGKVFVDELVEELHQNNRHYDVKLVKKVIGRFVETVSEEMKADHEILNYLQKQDLEKIIKKIDSISEGIGEIKEGIGDIKEQLKTVVEEVRREKGEPIIYRDGIPQSKNINLTTLFAEGEEHLENYEYDQAIKAFRTALGLQGLKQSECSALLISIGNAQYKQNKWDEARGSYKEALDWAEKGKDESGQAVALGNLGLVYKDKGEWDKAVEFYNKSLKIDEKIRDEYGMASTFNNLGMVYYSKGEWDKAIEFYNKSLKIKEKIGDEHGMAKTFNNLGMVYKSKGEWDKAIEFYNKSLKINEKIEDEYGMAQTKVNIGILYKMQGKKKEARKLFEESLKTLEKIGDRPNAEIARRHLEDLK